MIEELARKISLVNLRTIVKDHIRFSKSTSAFRKNELSELITIYLMILILKDEPDEFVRVSNVINSTMTKRWTFENWMPSFSIIKNGDAFVLLTQAFFGQVEWPVVRPLLHVTPVSPLICLDFLKTYVYTNIQFRIPKPRPTDPKCRYFLYLYRLQNTPAEYSTFISRNKSQFPQVLALNTDQIKMTLRPKSYDFYKAMSQKADPMQFEYFRSKSLQIPGDSLSSTTTETVLHRQEPRLDLKPDDLEISSFYDMNAALNHSLNLHLPIRSSVFPIETRYLKFNGDVNILIIEMHIEHDNMKPHVFQIVEAIVDHEEWLRIYGTISMVSSETVKKALFQNKSNNDDIESLNITLSLKCPLKMVRMKKPVRGANCKHLSCFDSSSVTILCNNARSFKCPNCNIDLSEEELVIDGYVQEILKNTGEGVDEVIIDSTTGEWCTKSCSSEALESSGEEQPMPKIPRMYEPYVSDVIESSTLLGSSITHAIKLE